MTIDQFLNALINFQFISFVKPFTLVLLFLHLLFSIVVLKQTKMMLEVVEAEISPVIFFISVAHFLVSLFVFIWVIVFL